jgi:Family of unknown function (DUF5931)
MPAATNTASATDTPSAPDTAAATDTAPTTDTMVPLWHGVVVLRAITAAFAIASILLHHDGFARPGWGWAVLAGISVWTVLSGLAYCAYSDDRTRRTQVVVLDVLVTLAFLGSSALVLSPEQLTGLARTPLLTTVWASGPVLAAAVQAGWVAGALVGLAVSALTVWLRAAVTIDLARDAILLIGTGLVLGLAAGAARQAAEQLRSSTRDEAATAERARLARSVHDSVLQVLARVRARSGQLDGGQLGGEAGELVRLAGEQEIALRHLSPRRARPGTPGRRAGLVSTTWPLSCSCWPVPGSRSRCPRLRCRYPPPTWRSWLP